MIKVGIVGYGNLGRGVSLAIEKAPDMELIGVFTRRNPESVKTAVNTKVYGVSELKSFKGKIDVLVLCGGSATDLPETTPEMLKDFNTVDSFDTHARIPEYFDKLDKIGKENGTLGLISVGWDPGLFSLSRLLFGSVLPDGENYTFWGKGVSQGHSDAVRRIDGVLKAVQYTVPKDDAVNLVKNGESPALSVKDKHYRECFVVAKDGADKSKIEREIKEMPNYFKDYDTTVHFITLEEFEKNHTSLPHGGFVIRNGVTSTGVKHNLEFSLRLDSNPEFTGSVVTAFARATFKMAKNNVTGAISAFDIPLKYLSPLSEDELRKTLL